MMRFKKFVLVDGIRICKEHNIPYMYHENENRWRCIECARVSFRRSRENKSKETLRQYWRHGLQQQTARKYGLTIAQREEMLSRGCDICGIQNRRMGSEDIKQGAGMNLLKIDHDHKLKKETGKIKIRGVLCHHCNVALGHFEDDIERLKKAIEYLECARQIVSE